MAQRTVLYVADDDRLKYIAEANAQGERMLHDDFAVGPEGQHRLTFEKSPEPIPDSNFAAKKALLDKLTRGTLTLDETSNLMRMERGL